VEEAGVLGIPVILTAVVVLVEVVKVGYQIITALLGLQILAVAVVVLG
jgi:hypothetical protein